MVKRTYKSGTDVLEEDRERWKQRKPSASGLSFGFKTGSEGHDRLPNSLEWGV